MGDRSRGDAELRDAGLHVRAGAFDAAQIRSRSVTRAIEKAAGLLHVDVQHLERLPDGGALLVTNHAFGFDAAFLMARVESLTGRRVWTLGEHAWWKVPGLRRIAAAAGTVDGTPESADQLLTAGELVLVLPGGLRESMKPHELKYRLLWGTRYGFVHAAIRNRVPIVPIASLGADDIFDLKGNAFARSRTLHLPFPLPRPRHFVPIVHRASIRYVICDPIPMPVVDMDDTASVDVVARRLRREIEGAIHEVFEEALSHACGFDPASRTEPR